MDDFFEHIQTLTGITKYSSSEVITPVKVASDMVSLLPSEVFNSKTKFIDPAVKSGRFLVEIYNRLMESPETIQEFPNESERSQHIIHTQLYGIATSPVAATITRKQLYGDATMQGNIVYESGYISKIKNNPSIIKEITKENFGDTMKFDVVIGNPPYQENTGGGNGQGGVAIYGDFVLGSIEVSARYVCMITPIRWYTGNRRLSSLRDKLTQSNNIVEFHDFPNTEDIFEDVYVMGGICYYLYDKQHNGTCKIVKHREGNIEICHRYMLEANCDQFIRDNNAAGIIRRIFSNEVRTLDEYISSTVPFGIATNIKGISEPKGDVNIPMYITGNEFKGGSVGYVSREQIPRGLDYIDRHKVFINTASDNMLRFPYDVLYKPFYGAPGTICNGSYIILGPVKSKEFCDNLISYLSTRFVRMLVLQRKADQRVYASTFKFVPVQDFSHPWTDEMLFNKYNLSEEEIAYIKQTIKPIE